MKQIFLFSALALTFAACGNSNTSEEKAATAPAEQNAMTEQSAETAKNPNAVVDPVCNMEKQADWDQYTVLQGDTTWFCSPHCKETFDKDPAKFAKK